MKPFDPWAIDLETQVALNEADELTFDQDMQIVIARSIAERRDAILQGGGLDVMEAVADCMRYGLATPSWLADEFRRRLRAVSAFEVSSWDDPAALGRPNAKGTHLATLRKESRAGPVIVHLVKHFRAEDPKPPLDDALFERVAQRLGNQSGLGRSECSRIYYERTREEGTAGNS